MKYASLGSLPLFIACAGPPRAVPARSMAGAPLSAPTGASPPRAAPAVRSAAALLATSGFTPPQVMPARYLRTLEYDPAGYSSERSAASGVSDLLLGDLLFHSPRVLGERAQALAISCNTCHPNGATHVELQLAALSDRPGNIDLSNGFFRAASEDGIANAVNVPSLRGCRYTGPYGRDGRTASLVEFMQGVVHGEFGGAALAPEFSAALLRYVQDLDFLPNRNLDAHNQLTVHASAEARRGAALFATPRAGFGAASCASCHPPSSFFRDGRVHRVGSAHPPSPNALDGGYETPTLLGLAETAPYFHDGRFARIADVVRWFNEGFSLGFSPDEERDLVAYVDAVGSVDRSRDDRPLAQKLDQVFAYVSLLTLRDRVVRGAVLDEIGSVLRQAPVSMRSRAGRALRALEALGSAKNPSREAIADLRRELARLAADWAGSVPPESDQLSTESRGR